ncbi:hypothetical protein CBR_g58653 [Chara braunii]|uniref:Inosine/uridine-preferring nucleoside hydrolase domain-containing protein n=1 Tax=Chara braunii TaxID=69332 RepID=A0A388MET5_CHABU|nr:hypothetical protein CBR_g58653 [Chara braunii]|eukprot:GBG93070.1 hypothetical protein CBR_g58653 [Chara braunii]
MAMARVKRAVWLDCDPGHDDAIAIILAAHSDNIDLLGISTVYGNEEVSKVTLNALKVLRTCGRDDIDVVAGQAKPLIRPRRACPEIHGETGLNGTSLPEPMKGPLRGKAVNVMYERISRRFQSPSEEGGNRRIALVCTASLTNIALLITVYPEMQDMIEGIQTLILSVVFTLRDRRQR